MNEAAFTISPLRILKVSKVEHFSDFKSRALQRPNINNMEREVIQTNFFPRFVHNNEGLHRIGIKTQSMDHFRVAVCLGFEVSLGANY